MPRAATRRKSTSAPKSASANRRRAGPRRQPALGAKTQPRPSETQRSSKRNHASGQKDSRAVVARLGAQLAVLNRVQQALTAKLSLQGIYDVVGDKIREIFHNADVWIRVYDPKTNLIQCP